MRGEGGKKPRSGKSTHGRVYAEANEKVGRERRRKKARAKQEDEKRKRNICHYYHHQRHPCFSLPLLSAASTSSKRTNDSKASSKLLAAGPLLTSFHTRSSVWSSLAMEQKERKRVEKRQAQCRKSTERERGDEKGQRHAHCKKK